MNVFSFYCNYVTVIRVKLNHFSRSALNITANPSVIAIVVSLEAVVGAGAYLVLLFTVKSAL